MFPANWIGLPYKFFHKSVPCFWFCHEPSAFIHIKKWRDAIQNPIKRTIAKILFPLLSIIDKKLATFADKIFVNSNYSKNIIQNVYKKDSIVIYPGVDSLTYAPVSFEKKENYILTVSRLTKFKNIDLLLSAFSAIDDQTITLKIIGDGEEKANLIELAEKLKISERVNFLSNIKDKELVNYYAKAKLFILCSKDEPFGIVPIEAMACGTTVIADNSGGPSETIINDKTGKLISCSAENLTEAINELTKDEEKLKQYSTDATAHVKTNFSWETAAEKLKSEIA